MNNSPVVILVDPNIIVKSRIKAILASQDVKIFEAINRHEVLSILSKSNYNVALVITEIEISTKNSFDGVSLIKLIKKMSSSIPVVVLTSICKKEVITKCLHEGIADYILKPFEDDVITFGVHFRLEVGAGPAPIGSFCIIVFLMLMAKSIRYTSKGVDIPVFSN
ncbi:MAG TPA: response regulator [Anaerovoracaceae bacterium]|nr:response regulator [Anaerovoracaceae bacterium]